MMHRARGVNFIAGTEERRQWMIKGGERNVGGKRILRAAEVLKAWVRKRRLPAA